MVATVNYGIRIIDQWQRLAKKIVFTNGCFDLIHLGHLDLLARAAEYGDRLVVGINSDNSIRRIKGNDRPLMGENSRSLLLSALKPVDLVIIFDEDTPYNLIEKITPDILIKGGDWPIDQIVGKDVVLASGGEVLSLPLFGEYSTTTLIEQIRKPR